MVVFIQSKETIPNQIDKSGQKFQLMIRKWLDRIQSRCLEAFYPSQRDGRNEEFKDASTKFSTNR